MTRREKRIFGILVLLNILGKVPANLTASSESESIEETVAITTTKKPIPERCLEKQVQGPCKHYVYKWSFHKAEGKCKMFPYGSCLGNENRFNSEAECLHYCIGGPDHTLPPYLVTKGGVFVTTSIPTSSTPPITTSSTPRPTFTPPEPTRPPVPKEERGKELTFMESGYEKTFMFAQSNTFIQLDGSGIKTFQLRLCREISFKFRTKLPHGLLVYHSVKDRPEGLEPYALYVIVEKGQLKVVHVFGKISTSITVGEGLNRDEWHSVLVRIDVHGAKLIARVDEKQAETSLEVLERVVNYGVSEELASVVLIGGLSSEERLHGVKYIIESFVGCIRDMVLSSGKSASDLLPIRPLIATKHENVKEGCIDKCRTRENLCFMADQCVNHYNSLTCDCFGTKYEGERCDVYTATILTLRGSSYVSFRVYDWKDRVHSSVNRISLAFKTKFDDSALFYASGEIDGTPHYIAASILNDSVVVELDFGHDSKIHTELGDYVTSDHWNNLTIFHNSSWVFVSLDEEVKVLKIPGENYNMIIDPEIYIGGGPELHKKKGLVSYNNFVGSLKYVFFNDKSIIYELKRSNPMVHYIGVLEPEYYEADVEVIPITYPFAGSHIWWPIEKTDSLKLNFDFKSSKPIAVIASGEVHSEQGLGYWELRLVNDEIRFQLIPALIENITVSTAVKFPPYNTSWHAVELNYTKGELNILVDYRNKQTKQLSSMIFELDNKVIIGSGKSNAGLVGCMRDIQVNGQNIEPRYIINTERVVGEVALDNCQFVDPCKRPNTCEHGGKCSVKEDRITCDCTDTGYIGKNCHFAQYRKTCEELALLDNTQDGVYRIDIDGNGRFPPAVVKCEFQSIEDSTKTIVEHNLPSQVDVRSFSQFDFSYSITYRQFTAEMLQELISHSLYCKQYVKYDCYKAPLELHSATWFLGSKGTTVDFIGNVNRGSCPCSENRTCVDENMSCNCDVSSGNAGKWLSDEGYYKTPDSLGITGMVFLQQKDLEEDAQGRITLGPLECVETNTQKYVVTFTTSQSYIEVPGWRKGDIAFSFRTTGERAILLYQPPIRSNYPSFMVALTSEYRLTFNFTLNTGTVQELEIKSGRKLNNGEWQKIWIDYNDYHVRFMINTDYQMVNLTSEEEFGPFEGSMFIGGATAEHLKTSSVSEGLIGCFRGLVVNGEILDIHSYMSVHLSEIIKDCKPSCQPNKCQNGAKCVEEWSKFKCVCKNKWAHQGIFCETNINNKALTFTSSGAFLKKNYFGSDDDGEKILLKSMFEHSILINLRTYDTHSLILYANDHLNNFIHLYISNGTNIVYLFNAGNEIKNITVHHPHANTGISIQIAIIHENKSTILIVNECNKTLNATPILLDSYSNKPWINPEKEVLAPQRPPAPPTDYFQMNLGGFDPDDLLRVGKEGNLTQGYVGCLRGLMIGKYHVDLPNLANEANHEGSKGVLPNCQMKCDAMPCKNMGICTEDFGRQESSCNCDLTSYFGEHCEDEKGADFSGDSVLQREFDLEGEVKQVKVQLAFSTNELRQRTTALLLLQTENKRSYYLLVALTSEGQLIFEEDVEGSVYGVRLNDRNFLNGARHSIYYIRENSTATLLIDRQEVSLIPIPAINTGNQGDDYDPGSTEIQLGGLNTTDLRFSAYKGYTGCLSNVVISINGGPIMKPLEEYMLFTKQGSETVRATSPGGVRSAQCAVFHAQPRGIESQRNDSVGRDRAWDGDPPERILYKSQYSDATKEEQGAGTYVFIALVCLFVAAVIGCIYEVWRSARKDRRRRRSAAAAASKSPSPSGSQRWQPQQYTDSLVTTTGIKTIGFKITDDEKRPNGTHVKATAKEYKPIPNTEPKELMNDKKVHIKADEEPEKKELLGVNTGIVNKPPKPNPFSMEDLREEPELEECEEEEDENDEKTDLMEEDDQEEQDGDKGNNAAAAADDDDDDEEDEEEEGDNEDGQEDEVLLKSVRDTSRRMSLIDNPSLNEEKGLLQTNFSVTGINEIKTECIPTKTTINNVNTNSNKTPISIKKDPPKRPMSLDLSVPVVFKRPHGGARFERVTARLIDPRDNMFKN
ncbi:PREDICTED: neurexin-2 isoform X1 [Polistes canadensis]|uniref:neurexin-2 isoform X1 n=1 Tax=Polistes canadensis TaxID=91411 RepID=UPI000718E461|nr:PREDICTED: neurexin-2 isoform X1 [Polistes canadensis]XP_014610849.1 PREDICTED: neurexin-2 isoform X1 [Polistes canadensis]